MWTTLEVRWFGGGQVPSPVQEWWRDGYLGKQMTAREQRTDIYLAIPQRPDLGIKQRQGKIEVKQRYREFGLINFNKDLDGKAERWTKVIYNQQQLEDFLAQNKLTSPIWLKLEKDRRQKNIETCTIEITTLKIDQQYWWTLALEQLMDASEFEVMETWKPLAQEILQDYPDLNFSERSSLKSCGYPEWLSNRSVHPSS